MLLLRLVVDGWVPRTTWCRPPVSLNGTARRTTPTRNAASSPLVGPVPGRRWHRCGTWPAPGRRRPPRWRCRRGRAPGPGRGAPRGRAPCQQSGRAGRRRATRASSRARPPPPRRWRSPRSRWTASVDACAAGCPAARRGRPAAARRRAAPARASSAAAGAGTSSGPTSAAYGLGAVDPVLADRLRQGRQPRREDGRVVDERGEQGRFRGQRGAAADGGVMPGRLLGWRLGEPPTRPTTET